MSRKLSLPLLVAFSLFAAAASAADNRFPYQGHLEKDGVPLNGTFDFQFRLFSVASAGTQLWVETRSGIQVTAGAFSTTLGAATAIPDAVLNNPTLFLQVSVRRVGEPTFVTLTGRQQLLNVPKARSGAWEHVASSTSPNTGSTVPVNLAHHSIFRVLISGRLSGVVSNSTMHLGLDVNGIQSGYRQVQTAGANFVFRMLDKQPGGVSNGDVACDYLVSSQPGTGTVFFKGSCVHDDGATLYTYENTGVSTGKPDMTSLLIRINGATTAEVLTGQVTVLGLRK